MPGQIDKLMGIHPQAITLRSKRASLLASNLANGDTPNYKARDIDFQQMLAQEAGKGVQLKRTDSRHLSLSGGPGFTEAALKYRVPANASLDGNTVDTQVEQGKFAENALHYQTSLKFLNSKINGLIKTLRSE